MVYRTGEVQEHKSEWLTPLAGGLVKKCLLAFYYAIYYAILFFTTLFTTLREAPANDLYVFGTFQTASTDAGSSSYNSPFQGKKNRFW